MYRKGVCALIMNTKQELLVVNLEVFEERYFAVPGGGQDEGETLEYTVYRELKEELGIERNSLEPVGMSSTPIVFDFKSGPLSRDGIPYIGQEKYCFGFNFIGDENSIHPADGEVRSFKWVQLTELHKYLLFENELEGVVERVKEMFKIKV